MGFTFNCFCRVSTNIIRVVYYLLTKFMWNAYCLHLLFGRERKRETKIMKFMLWKLLLSFWYCILYCCMVTERDKHANYVFINKLAFELFLLLKRFRIHLRLWFSKRLRRITTKTYRLQNFQITLPPRAKRHYSSFPFCNLKQPHVTLISLYLRLAIGTRRN